MSEAQTKRTKLEAGLDDRQIRIFRRMCMRVRPYCPDGATYNYFRENYADMLVVADNVQKKIQASSWAEEMLTGMRQASPKGTDWGRSDFGREAKIIKAGNKLPSREDESRLDDVVPDEEEIPEEYADEEEEECRAQAQS